MSSTPRRRVLYRVPSPNGGVSTLIPDRKRARKLAKQLGVRAHRVRLGSRDSFVIDRAAILGVIAVMASITLVVIAAVSIIATLNN